MQIHGGRVVARALKREGVPYVFTLCGGHVMSIYDGCLDEGIGIVDVRHEQSAAHAADGWARVTGQPGVAIVTAGPGLTDAVSGVATVWRANSPMVVIGGQAPRFFQDMGGLQDMAHVDLMKPITKWAVSVPHARRLGEYVASAFRVATTNVPGPVFLEMPLDLLFDNLEESEVVVSERSRTEAGVAPDPRYVERAFDLLRGAQRPVCRVGSQLFWSRRREAYPEFVRTFGMPVYVNGQARGSLDPEDPHWFLQTRKAALKRPDVAVILGTPDTIGIGDGGDFVGSAANVLRPRGFGHWLDAGPLGTLGAGPGYAMAAKLASPRSDVIIMYGDGAFGLNMMEFEACIRQKINIVGVIGNDAAWTQILRGQVQMYGPDRTPACKLAPSRYDRMIEALGGHGEWVERPEHIRPALERALGAGKPAVVNVRIGGSDFRKDAISV